MKKTDVLAAPISSSTCASSVRLAFGVNRLAEVSRSRCASSRIRTSTSFGRRVAVLVEVAELRAAGALADDAADVLGEGLAAGRVLRVVAELRQLADQVQRDDALAGAGAALDDRRPTSSPRGSPPEPPPGPIRTPRAARPAARTRCCAAIIAAVWSSSFLDGRYFDSSTRLMTAMPVAGAEVQVQEVGQLGRLVAGEEGIGLERLGVPIGPQLAGRVELHVVEVADRGQPDRIGVVEDGVVVEQPLLVAADLDRWMEHAPDLLADERLDAAVGR